MFEREVATKHADLPHEYEPTVAVAASIGYVAENCDVCGGKESDVLHRHGLTAERAWSLLETEKGS